MDLMGLLAIPIIDSGVISEPIVNAKDVERLVSGAILEGGLLVHERVHQSFDIIVLQNGDGRGWGLAESIKLVHEVVARPAPGPRDRHGSP